MLTSSPDAEPPNHASTIADLLVPINQMQSSEDLAAVSSRICSALANDLGAVHSSIVLLDIDSTQAHLAGEHPVHRETSERMFPIRNDPSELPLLLQHDPVFTPPPAKELWVAQLGRLGEWLFELGLKFAVLVPVSRSEGIAAWIIAGFPVERAAPDARELTRMNHYAALFTTALDRSRLFQSAQVRATAVIESAQRISAALDPEELIHVLVAEAVSLTGSQSGGLYKYDKKTTDLSLVASYNRPANLGRRLRLGDGIAGRMIMNTSYVSDWRKRIDMTPEYDKDPRRSQEYQEGQFGAVLEVLLLAGDERYGVLFVDDRVGRNYTIRDGEELLYLGNFALVALANASQVSLFKEKAASERIADALRTASGLTDGLQKVAEVLPSIFHVAFCRILLNDRRTDSEPFSDFYVRAAAAAPASRDWDPGTGRALERIHAFELKQAAGLSPGGGPVYLKDVDENHARFLTRFGSALEMREPLRALCLIPISMRGTEIGYIELGKLVEDRYPHALEESNALAREVGAQVGGFADRAWLIETEGRRRAMLDNLQQKLRHLRSSKGAIRLREEGLRLAAELVEGSAATLSVLRPASGEPELIAQYEQAAPASPEERQRTFEMVRRAARDNAPASCTVRRATEATTTVAVPLIRESGAWAVLEVSGISARPGSLELEIDCLQRFGDEMSKALEIADFLTSSDQVALRLNLLNPLVRFIYLEEDIYKVMHAVLTVMTASYGFGFNRAGILLLGRDAHSLEGRIGIGQILDSEKSEIWDRIEKQAEPGTFSNYLERLNRGAVEDTSLDRALAGLKIPVSSLAQDPFSHVIRSKYPYIVRQNELGVFPQSFRDAVMPTTDVLLVPLFAPGTVTGVLFADSKFTKTSITNAELDAIEMIAAMTALGIERRAAAVLAGDQVNRLRNVLGSPDPDFSKGAAAGLKEALVKLCREDVADGASIILIDENRAVEMYSAGADREVDLAKLVRPGGHSIQAMTTGKPVIPDPESEPERMTPNIIREDYRSSVCVPIPGADSYLGVLWLHYFDHQDFGREDFWDVKLAAVTMYARSIGAGYENAIRFEEHEGLMRAAEQFSKGEEPKAISERVALAAQAMFHADFVTFWPYSDLFKRFVKEDVVALNLPRGELPEPRLGSMTFRVLADGYLRVEDLRSLEQEAPGIPEEHKVYERFTIVSFQAIRMEAEGQYVGVLYVSYKNARRFGTRDRKALEQLSRLGSLAIKQSHLEAQLRRALRGSGLVSEAGASDDLGLTLQSIADGMNFATGCECVVVHSYDESARRFGQRSGMAGVENVAEAQALFTVRPESILRFIVERDSPMVVASTATEPLFQNLPFVLKERIVSTAALPLVVRGRRVGVMFLNYRTPHEFTPREISDIRFFANQAAAIIRSAQQIESVARDAKLSRALSHVSGELLSSRSVQQVLDTAVELTRRELDVEFTAIVLPNMERKLVYMAGTGWDPGYRANLTFRMGRESHVGYTLKERRPVAVLDFNQPQPFEVPDRIREEGVRSGVGIPMRDESEVIGALMVHSKRLRVFSESEISFLSAAANQAAIALKSARRYQDLLAKHVQLSTIAGVLEESAGDRITERSIRLDALLRDLVDSSGRGWGVAALYAPGASQTFGALVVYPRNGLSSEVEAAAATRLCDQAVQKGQHVSARTEGGYAHAVPISADGVAIAVIYLTNPGETATPENLQAAQDAALRIAGSIRTTELEMLAAAAVRQVEEAKMLLVSAAHQLRDPLGSARYATGELRKAVGTEISGRHRARVEMAHVAINDSLRIVTNLLENYRQRDESSEDASANVNEIIADCIRGFGWRADKKRIELSQNTRHPELDAAVSDDAVRSALSNLLSNAIRHAPKDGHVGIEAARDGSYIIITVTDDGPGIIPQQLATLFRKPERLGSVNSTGFGLGLYIARQNLNRYGGDIRALNRPEGGARFVVSLPRLT